MELFPPHSTPRPLYLRALELDLVPRVIPDLAAYALPSFSARAGPPLHRHAIALLAAAELTPAQRDAIERGDLAYAQRSSSHPLQGATAYADLVPYLTAERQATARQEAQPVLERLASYIRGRAWEAPYGLLLRYRDVWRVLAPDLYPAWLQHQLGTLLTVGAWCTTPEQHREHLAHLHLLTVEEQGRALSLALECVQAVGDAEVTDDREWAFAGGRIFSDADVANASRAAQIEVLSALAPLLPPPLHARARTLAEERGISLDDVLGSRWTDPLAIAAAPWYYALPKPAVPWLTPYERQPIFAALDDATRARLLDDFVASYVELGTEFLSNLPRRAVTGDVVAARFRQLVDEDTPVAAPLLTAEQLLPLHALYQLP